MKIVFLDVDGVLNRVGRCGGSDFDRECVMLLKRLLCSTGAQVVVSSSWREDPALLARVYEMLNDIGVTSFSRTCDGNKALSILNYIESFRPDEYVVIDDDENFGLSFGNRFVFANPLDEDSLLCAISVLNEGVTV